MTRATLLALLAGVAAAAAIVEVAALAGAGAAARSRGREGDSPARRWARLAVTLGRRAGLTVAPPGDLSDRLAAAGLGALGVRDVMAAKVGGALAAGLAGLVPASLAPGRLGPVVALVVPALAFLAPDAWLRRRARQRGRVMADELPEVLDLLRVVVAAGMPLGRALGEVGARRGGLLAGEFARAAARMALGVPRAQAVLELRRRCPVPAAGALAVAIERSERHGVPLAPALAGLAADARADRARRLTDRAAKAAPKIQLVVALLLVPAVMLFVAAALLAALR